MKKLLQKKVLLTAALTFAIFTIKAGFGQSFQLLDGVTVEMVNKDRASELLRTEDEYTAVLSIFDLQSKTGRTGELTVKDYLEHSSSQALSWNEKEIEMMENIFTSIRSKIEKQNLKLNFPNKIELVKTTMDEESGASAYTRLNYIVTGEEFLKVSPEAVEGTMIHELFHILSRNDREMRDKLYQILGFTKTEETLYPAEIKDLRISNPDAPLNNYFITLNKGGESKNLMMILFANKPYTGGSFFRYLQIGLMAINLNNNIPEVKYLNGKPEIYKLEDFTDFFEKVGKNTNYIIHPEEISADHFKLLLNEEKNLPNPELINEMKRILTQ